jgi:hypothetical protein
MPHNYFDSRAEMFFDQVLVFALALHLAAVIGDRYFLINYHINSFCKKAQVTINNEENNMVHFRPQWFLNGL